MSVLRIAYNNFKNNIKIYTMFFISMIFSVVILSNFMILLKGNTLDYLGKMNKEYSKMTLQILIIMLTLFMLFFIWYSSNIFLKNRKKEIGIYTFMGLILQNLTLTVRISTLKSTVKMISEKKGQAKKTKKNRSSDSGCSLTVIRFP